MEQAKVGRLIAQRRKEKQLTQQQLADQLHVTNKAVSKWEQGRSLPDVAILPQLAAALGLTTDELLAGKRVPVRTTTPPSPPPYVSPEVIRRQTLAQLRRYWQGVALQLCGWVIVLGQIIGSLRIGLIHLLGDFLGSLAEQELISISPVDWNFVFPWISVFRYEGQTMWRFRSIWALWLAYPVTFLLFLCAAALMAWGILLCRRARRKNG